MAKRRNVADQAAEQPARSSAERKFPYEVLKANCMKLFRVTSSTFIGATIGMESGAYTIAEMQSVVKGWLKKEVKE